jgi:hypothetical protein
MHRAQLPGSVIVLLAKAKENDYEQQQAAFYLLIDSISHLFYQLGANPEACPGC